MTFESLAQAAIGNCCFSQLILISLSNPLNSGSLVTILTFPALAILQFPLLFAIFHHGFHHALAFDGAAQAVDEFGGDGFDEDALRRGLDAGAGAFFDFKFLTEPARDDQPALCREVNSFRFGCPYHAGSLHHPETKAVSFCWNYWMWLSFNRKERRERIDLRDWRRKKILAMIFNH